jgi:hypothetical protein
VQPQASMLMLHALDSLVAAVLVDELGVRALCGGTNYLRVGPSASAVGLLWPPGLDMRKPSGRRGAWFDVTGSTMTRLTVPSPGAWRKGDKMPTSVSSMAWGGSLAWFGAIALCSFLITWVVTDLLRVRRTAYVGLLALLTGGLTYGYLAWSQTDAVGFLRYHWAWGLLAAALTIGMNLELIRLLVRRGRLHAPPRRRLHGRSREVQVLWEDVIYGASEGMLLSVLPVLGPAQPHSTCASSARRNPPGPRPQPQPSRPPSPPDE